ncbi:MAG: LTA synthase family protein [Thermodesulfobacteriota bacterium]
MIYVLYLLISLLLLVPYLDFFIALHSILPPGYNLLFTILKQSIKLFMMFSIVPVFYFYFLKVGSKIYKILFIIGFNTIYFFTFIALRLYFNYYQDTPEPSLLFASSSELWTIKEQILYQLLQPLDYWLIALWPIVIILSFLFIKKIKLNNLKNLKLKYVTIGLLLVYTSYIGAQFIIESPAKRIDFHSTDAIRAYGITWTAAGLAYKSIRDHFCKEKTAIPYPGKISKNTVLASLPSSLLKGSNIIIIQTESLEKLVMDKKINNVEITPFLNRLKKHSIFFEHFYSQHYGGGTSDAELSTLTSLLPISDHPSFQTIVPGKVESLAHVLKRHGYTSAGFHANYGNIFSREMGFKNLDFDKFYSANYFSGKAKGFYSWDKEFFKQSMKYIQNMPKPFFAYLITVQSHGPFRNYHPETPSLFHFENTDYNTLERNYISVIHEVDEAIGELFHLLDQAGLIEHTIIILFADHKSRAFNDPSIDECIPLLICHKNLSPKTNDTIGSHVDIAPTIAHLLNIQEGKNWLGNSLFDLNQKQTIIRGEDLIHKTSENKIKVEFDPSLRNYYLFSKFMVN